LIIPTKNPQFKKNQISYTALPHQMEDFTPPSTKSSVWWSKAEKEIQFFLYCGYKLESSKRK